MSAMILRIKTDNAGTSTSDQFRLPLASTSTYDFTIDWGDTNVETITNASAGFPNITHTYATAGEYDVSITENVVGGFPTIYFNGGGDRNKLLELKQWGTNKWLTFKNSFKSCCYLRITATDEATANTGFVTNYTSAWYTCMALTSFPLIDTSGALLLDSAWYYCVNLQSFAAINTASVTSVLGAWYYCIRLRSFPLINLSACTGFIAPWFGCALLETFPAIDFSNGTIISSLFTDCQMLSPFPALNLRKMGTALPDTSLMFYNCTLSVQRYSDLLIDLAAFNLNNNVSFTANLAQYNSSAVAARATLISRGWTIVDQGLYTGVVTISSISPNWGAPAGGNQIVITGAGFGATPGEVLIALVKQTVVSWSDTSITVTVSAHGEGWASVEVTNAAGDKQILPATQSYLYTSLDTAALIAAAQAANNSAPTNGAASLVVGDSCKVAGVTYNGTTDATIVAIRSTDVTKGSTAGGKRVRVRCLNAEAAQGAGTMQIGTVAGGYTNCTIISWSNDIVDVTVPAHAAGVVDFKVTTNGGRTDTFLASFTYVAASATGMDRKELCDALKAMLQADTDILYGSGKLISTISTNYNEFISAKVDVATPYKLYLVAPERAKVETRAGNADYTFTVNFRIEGLANDPDAAQQVCDNIDERIDYLLDNEMWTGKNMSDYHSNTISHVVDMSWKGSTCNVIKQAATEGGFLRVEAEGTMIVVVNRLRN